MYNNKYIRNIDIVQDGVRVGCLPGHCSPRPGAKADKVYIPHL